MFWFSQLDIIALGKCNMAADPVFGVSNMCNLGWSILDWAGQISHRNGKTKRDSTETNFSLKKTEKAKITNLTHYNLRQNSMNSCIT